MWHELVLHGIGGRTIAEAKERMTHTEALSWQAYIQKRGSLNIGRRLESAAGLLAMVINRSVGGKAKMEDFMPYEFPADREGTIDDVFSMLKSMKRGA